jgi:hypothetical protein
VHGFTISRHLRGSFVLSLRCKLPISQRLYNLRITGTACFRAISSLLPDNDLSAFNMANLNQFSTASQ